jgi:C1A family cysteine protease
MMDPKDYKFGTQISRQDDRDFELGAVVSCAFQSFPNTFRIMYPGKPKDQGRVGSCVAHSLSYVKEVLEYRQTNKFNLFSVGFIYGNRKTTDYQGEGMEPRDALKHLLNEGDCYNEDFDYNLEWPEIKNVLNKVKSNLLRKSRQHKIKAFARLKTADEVKMALMTLGPVTFAMHIYDSFYDALNAPYIIPRPDVKKESWRGDHQMTFFGWTETAFIILNTWDTQGDNGYIYLPFDQFDMVLEAWAVSQGPIPTNSNFIADTFNCVVNFFKNLF